MEAGVVDVGLPTVSAVGPGAAAEAEMTKVSVAAGAKARIPVVIG